MMNDVSRAFFHAKAKRQVYVQLAVEDQEHGQERMCGRLNCSMYGTRDVAQNWFDEYSQMLVSIGFRQGAASPCVFFHKERNIRTFVRGDDYVSTGKPNDLQWMKRKLEEKYQIKTQMLGHGKEYTGEVKILNRIVVWNQIEGITYEADPRHVEIILEQLNLKDAETVTTPGICEEGRTQEDLHVLLEFEQASTYRALVARCQYIAPDRLDIAYTVKELARGMAVPTRGEWQRFKRLGRYLKGTAEVTTPI